MDGSVVPTIPNWVNKQWTSYLKISCWKLISNPNNIGLKHGRYPTIKGRRLYKAINLVGNKISIGLRQKNAISHGREKRKSNGKLQTYKSLSIRNK